MNASAQLDEIVIENVGPVDRLHIPLPDGGGLVVLTGDNGAGKSESLDAISGLLGNDRAKKALRTRDGEKTGLIEGCGITIKVGRQNRAAGELTVSALEDRLDIATLVDPEIDSPAAADRARLKALIRVSCRKADPGLFEGLSLEPLNAIVPSEVMEETDLIKQASGIKRAFESNARKAEDQATNFERSEKICLESVKDVDLTAESDADELQRRYDTAVNRANHLDVAVLASRKAIEAVQDARFQLDEARKSYTGPDVATADLAVQGAESDEESARDLVRRLEDELTAARSTYQSAQSETTRKRDALTAAKDHADTISRWSAALESSTPEAPSQTELDQAASDMQAAKLSFQQGEVVRRAKEKLVEANEFKTKRNAVVQLATAWRDAAAGVDGVLSEIVTELGSPISVGEDDKGEMRLMVNHPRRGEMFFSDLSVGEKWNLVLPIAINAVGEGGVFTIPQQAYEGLQPANRRRLAQLLKGSGVTAITALPADGPLAAEEVPA